MLNKLKYFFTQLKNHIAIILTFILLVLVAFLSIFFVQKENKLLSLLQTRTDNYKKEIDDLRALRDNEIKERIQIEQRFKEQIERLKADNSSNVQNISKEKEALIKEVLKETKDSPEKAAQRINDIFGIPQA